MSVKNLPVRSDDFPIGKVVGRRRPGPTSIADADRLLRTAWALRGTDKLVPRGLYRFNTFEEAATWMTRMTASTHALLRSTTSPGSPEPKTRPERATF